MTTITPILPDGMWVSETVPPEVIDRIYEGLVLNNRSVPVPTPVPIHSICNTWGIHACVNLGDPRIIALQWGCMIGVVVIGILVHLIIQQRARRKAK